MSEIISSNLTDKKATAADSTPLANPLSGMTTRVVQGSLWTLGGQGVTLLVILVTNPFIIRRLGAEAYGVLTLINVLIGYLAFADMGMGQAATRFGAEAHARKDEKAESAVVWNTLLIAGVPTLISALLLAVFARLLVENFLQLPQTLSEVAIVAIRLASIGFVARTFVGIFNAPQMIRLRLDLNSLVLAGTGVAQNCLMVLVLWLNGGLLGAVLVMTGMAMVMLATQLIISQRLLPGLARPRLGRATVKPLLRFGGGMMLSTIASLLVTNAEKLLLVRFASVTALAHYGVAASLASMLTLVPAALRQSLLPAFSRMQSETSGESVQRLYSRIIRGAMLWIAPIALLLCATAKPFFTLWAGAEYGRESTLPFYILIVGLLFNVLAFIPHALLVAKGRSDIIARIHLAEVLPYMGCAIVLPYWFGASGAALAWSLRVMVDALLFFSMARRIAGVRFAPFPTARRALGFAGLFLLIPLPLVFQLTLSPFIAIGISLLAVMVYALVIWLYVLSREERLWVVRMLANKGWLLSSGSIERA